MGLLSGEAHSVDDLLVLVVVASVTGGASGIKVTMERDFLFMTLSGEERQVVLVVSKDGLEASLTRPGLLEPALEGLESATDGSGESSGHILLEAHGGVLLHVVERKLSELTTLDDCAEVRNFSHGLLHL